MLIRGPAAVLTGPEAARLVAQLRHDAEHGALAPDLIPTLRKLDAVARMWWGRDDNDFHPETPDTPSVTASASATPGRSRVEWVSAREAGAVLGLTSRRVGQLAEQFGGHRNERGQWRFDPERIADEAERRKAG